MSHVIPFDTLNYAKKRVAVGCEPKLAEVLELGFFSKAEAESESEAESEASIAAVLHEINLVRHEVSLVKAEMNRGFATVKAELIKWVFGISAAQAMLILGALKFFH